MVLFLVPVVRYAVNYEMLIFNLNLTYYGFDLDLISFGFFFFF